MYIQSDHQQSQVQTGKPRNPILSVERNSVFCPDLLASSVSLTHSSNGREVATVRPRRIHNGYVITTADGRCVFEPWAGAATFGTVLRGDGKGPEAVIRPVRDRVIAVDVAGATYLVYATPGATFAIDRVYQSSNGTADIVHSGAAHAIHAVSRKAERKASPFVFDFSEPVPALLIPLLVVIIRESIRKSASSHSQSKPGMPASLLKAPVVAVTAAVGAAVC